MKLSVSSSPHIKGNSTTQKIMLDVIIALAPALIVSIVYFGINSLLLALVCVLTAVLSEYLSRKVMKRENTVSDLSAVVTGLILALNLPPTLPLWMAAFGSIVAIVVVKQFFGGLGQNFVNPAITARIILMLCFAGAMTTWTEPFSDGVTGATPLATLSTGEGEFPSLLNMLLGLRGGSMGEVCSLALILGGIYLVIRKVISPIIPLTFVGTVFVCALFKGFDYAIYSILSGGLMLGAIFMATDYVTSPITKWGRVIYGIGCGLITVAIRFWGALPEGVSYAILLMNILTPHIDNLTLPKPFGLKKEGKNAKA